MGEREHVRVIGFCTLCFRMRYIAWDGKETVEGKGSVPQGVCGDCKRDDERESEGR